MALKSKKKSSAKKVSAKPKRARTDDGQFVPDDPATLDINEAYVQPDADQARREAQRAKFAPKTSGTGTRRIGGKLV